MRIIYAEQRDTNLDCFAYAEKSRFEFQAQFILSWRQICDSRGERLLGDLFDQVRADIESDSTRAVTVVGCPVESLEFEARRRGKDFPVSRGNNCHSFVTLRIVADDKHRGRVSARCSIIVDGDCSQIPRPCAAGTLSQTRRSLPHQGIRSIGGASKKSLVGEKADFCDATIWIPRIRRQFDLHSLFDELHGFRPWKQKLNCRRLVGADQHGAHKHCHGT